MGALGAVDETIVTNFYNQISAVARVGESTVLYRHGDGYGYFF
jgi:hypothetical protein